MAQCHFFGQFCRINLNEFLPLNTTLLRKNNDQTSDPRSAISSFILLGNEHILRFGSHPLVIRFMKAFVKAVFISLKDLTLKLVMLFALVATARVQTLHLLNLDTMHKHKNSYVFNQEELIKQSRPGYDNPDVVAKAFPADRRLCVYKVLQ